MTVFLFCFVLFCFVCKMNEKDDGTHLGGIKILHKPGAWPEGVENQDFAQYSLSSEVVAYDLWACPTWLSLIHI